MRHMSLIMGILLLMSCAGTVVKTTPVVATGPSNSVDTYTPGSGWNLAWEEDFEDDTFDTNIWTRQSMLSPYNNEWQQYYDSSAYAYEEAGNMVIKAVWDGITHGDNHYKSARVLSNPGGSSGTSSADGKTFLYGKIAARIQLPYGKGIWPAFWLLGDNISETGGDTDWPQCGEIDILESGSASAANYGQGTVSGALHHDPGTEEDPLGYNSYLSGGSVTLPNEELLAEDFHVYEIEWDEESVTWKMDGVSFGSQSITGDTKNEFHEAFYIILNIAVGGDFTNDPDDSTVFPQYMYVDWIRHYTN